MTNYERKNCRIGTNFRVALIPRFANLKRREKKNPANFNVAKFNILLYSLFSQFNEETYVYVLCIMCKSFMACLQMTNNSLTVTVKFHYLRCFDLFVCITIVVFRSFQHLFCTVIEMTIYPGFFIIWNDNLFIVFKYCLVPFGSISAVPCKGISNPPCTSGDPLWFLPMTLPQTITRLSRKKRVALEISPGKWPTAESTRRPRRRLVAAIA